MVAKAEILIIEDNEDDFDATMRSFRKNHFPIPVRWCRSGQEGLDYLFQRGAYANDATVQRPKLLLLDLNMPGLDGRQVLQIIKGDAELKKIPVIVLTTSSDERDVEDCYQLGASTYITKPVSFDKLNETVRTLKEYWFSIALLPTSHS